MKDKIDNMIIRKKCEMYCKKFNDDNNGMGVVEVILIILVLVGLAIIFRTKITSIVNGIFNKITTKLNSFT